VAGDAAVREEVGRVGEDEVDAAGGHGGEDLEAIAVEEGEVVGAVFEVRGRGDEGMGARAGRFADGAGWGIAGQFIFSTAKATSTPAPLKAKGAAPDADARLIRHGTGSDR
jgi:hypothetical protein